jgi:hypothetical protein
MDQVPEEFKKIMHDFIGDILITFPEYEPVISKWRPQEGDGGERMVKLYEHCMEVYPDRFMDILCRNTEMFSHNTEFLPGISFNYLWKSDISEKTREPAS